MITEIVSDKNLAPKIEFGFLDNALFLARKHASHENPEIRGAVAETLAAICRMGPEWRLSAAEAVNEIDMQPSEEARSTASRARRAGGLKRNEAR
jgi:hypothetical protein